MAADTRSGGTDVHQGPARPAADPGRPALICAFPRATALPVPDSGSVVGRAWLAEHGIDDTKASSAHLRFSRAGGVLRVSDVGSRNGTWVEGTRLPAGEEITLRDGAVLRAGRTLLVARTRLRGPLEPAPPLGQMVGPFGLRALSAAVEGLRHQRCRNVLIEGETGTGKELAARAVADALGRAGSYVAVNVAGVAAGVFESQLFGHVAGAFSGAGSAKDGLVVAHDGGTLFLDEIGELALDLQAKLLRLLDGGEVLAVGAERPRTVDVAVVAATNRSLEAEVEAGRFRADLFARLAAAHLCLPALRDRPEDVVPIARALRAESAWDEHTVEVEAAERLLLEPWPRNVRQLASTLAACARLDPAPGLRLWALDEVLGQQSPAPTPALAPDRVEEAILACGGNVTEAARRLGISRGKLLRLRKRAGA